MSEPAIRPAVAADAEAIVGLIALLDHPVTLDGVRARLDCRTPPTLVAADNGEPIALCGLDISTPVHRDQPVGRITILIVAPTHRGRGVGRMLVAEAERRLAEAGCGLIEITSNRRHSDAHSFYAHLGYEQPSLRFAKKLS